MIDYLRQRRDRAAGMAVSLRSVTALGAPLPTSESYPWIWYAHDWETLRLHALELDADMLDALGMLLGEDTRSDDGGRR